MDGALLLTALERIEREKGIDKEILFEAIESALASAARKVIDDPDVAKEDIEAVVNRETGEFEVYSDGVEVQSERFGRIAAQTAKQVMIQKIREAERDVISEKYGKQTGSILSGSVHRFEKGNIIIELDDAEAVLPKTEQIPRERFRQGELIRAYLLKVERGSSGPELVLSRTDVGFIKKLFELEVPEISQGIVEIKAIAREAGERTKMAVFSKDEKVDPVGACVGMRGSRVRDIVKELNGERIDIIRWADDIREYLPAAVNPAEVSRMVIDRDNMTITLTVPQDQLSLLIGKKGRNIRLASKLLGWELIAEPAREPVNVPISEVKGIGKKTMETLVEAGYDIVDQIIDLGVEGLQSLDGIGAKTAEKIAASCEEIAASEADKRKKEEQEKKEKEANEAAAAKAEEEAVKAQFEKASSETSEEEGVEEPSEEEPAEVEEEPVETEEEPGEKDVDKGDSEDKE